LEILKQAAVQRTANEQLLLQTDWTTPIVQKAETMCNAVIAPAAALTTVPCSAAAAGNTLRD